MICRQSRRFLAAAALALVWILAIVTPSHAQSHLLYDSSHYDTPDVIYSLGSNPTGVHKIGVYYQSISSGNATKPYPNFPPDGLAIDDVQVSHFNAPTDDVLVITSVKFYTASLHFGGLGDPSAYAYHATFYLCNSKFNINSGSLFPDYGTLTQIGYVDGGTGFVRAGASQFMTFSLGNSTPFPITLNMSDTRGREYGRTVFYLGMASPTEDHIFPSALGAFHGYSPDLVWLLSDGPDKAYFSDFFFLYNSTVVDGSGNQTVTPDGTYTIPTPQRGQAAVQVYGYTRSHYYETRPVPILNTAVSQNTGFPFSVVASNSSGEGVTLTGFGFDPGSYVTLNGVPTGSQFLDVNHLGVYIPPSLLTAPNDIQIVVTNPAPGGGASAVYHYSVVSKVADMTPVLTTVSPDVVMFGLTGTETFTLTGQHFFPQTQMLLDGKAVPTTYVSDMKLTGQVARSYFTQFGFHNIAAYTPSPRASGLTSNTLQVAAIYPVPNPMPFLSSSAPAFALVGQGDTPITLNGHDFVSASTVYLDTTPLPTTYLSGTQLAVTLPAAKLADFHDYNITVLSPPTAFFGSDGGTSNGLFFRVGNIAANLASLSPNSVPYGQAADITLTGTGFLPGSFSGSIIDFQKDQYTGTVVELIWTDAYGGSPTNVLPTTYVSPTQVKIHITTDQISAITQAPHPIFMLDTHNAHQVPSGVFSPNYLTVTGVPTMTAPAASGVTDTQANIVWNTSQPMTSLVRYGTSPSDISHNNGLDSSLVAAHSSPLTGLSPATTYYYRAESADTYGGFLYKTGSFTTAAAGSPNLTILGTPMLTRLGNALTVEMTLHNGGAGAANGAGITGAALRAATGTVAANTPLPSGLTIPAGASQIITLTFPGASLVAGRPALLKVTGSYTGGVFSAAPVVILP